MGEINEKAYKDGIIFLSVLSKNKGIILPDICTIDDGELNFGWRLEGVRLDLGFYGDGKYSYYGELTEGSSWWMSRDEDCNIIEVLPDELINALKGR